MRSMARSTHSPVVTGVITAEPAEGSWTDQYAVAANATLEGMGLNTTGDAFAPIEVTLNEGGN